jgi:hypothetical protein
MSMRPSLTRQYIRQALLSGPALLSVSWALPAAAISPITYGRTVQGTLDDANDAVLPDCRPTDRYRAITRAPVQTCVVRAISATIPVVVSLLGTM